MKVLLAVIDDLFQFAQNAVFGSVPYKLKTPKKKTTTNATTTVASSDTNICPLTEAPSFKLNEQYFVGVIDAFLYNDPVLGFDTAIRNLQYGQHVRLVSLQGRWAQVRLAGLLGWVLKDDLVLRSDDVYPKFLPHTEINFSAEQPEVIKLRAYINDMFGGARGNYELSAAEYVQYKLMKKKKYIDWGDIRMRTPGTWQRKLRGRTGVHIGIHPKTDSVMEYVIDDVGYLAFVEAVFPDGSITVSEIGKYTDATYTEDTLSADHYIDIQPIFLSVQ